MFHPIMALLPLVMERDNAQPGAKYMWSYQAFPGNTDCFNACWCVNTVHLLISFMAEYGWIDV